MDTILINQNGIEMARVHSDQILIADVQSALDLMASVNYATGSRRLILEKSLICEEFFDLKTKLAGDILQKFVNYQVKIAIVGDFSRYASQSLRDFIHESNQGKDIFFVADEAQAIAKLAR
jgi:hypothetical protein